MKPMKEFIDPELLKKAEEKRIKIFENPDDITKPFLFDLTSDKGFQQFLFFSLPFIVYYTGKTINLDSTNDNLDDVLTEVLNNAFKIAHEDFELLMANFVTILQETYKDNEMTLISDSQAFAIANAIYNTIIEQFYKPLVNPEYGEKFDIMSLDEMLPEQKAVNKESLPLKSLIFSNTKDNKEINDEGIKKRGRLLALKKMVTRRTKSGKLSTFLTTVYKRPDTLTSNERKYIHEGQIRSFKRQINRDQVIGEIAPTKKGKKKGKTIKLLKEFVKEKYNTEYKQFANDIMKSYNLKDMYKKLLEEKTRAYMEAGLSRAEAEKQAIDYLNKKGLNNPEKLKKAFYPQAYNQAIINIITKHPDEIGQYLRKSLANDFRLNNLSENDIQRHLQFVDEYVSNIKDFKERLHNEALYDANTIVKRIAKYDKFSMDLPHIGKAYEPISPLFKYVGERVSISRKKLKNGKTSHKITYHVRVTSNVEDFKKPETKQQVKKLRDWYANNKTKLEHEIINLLFSYLGIEPDKIDLDVKEVGSGIDFELNMDRLGKRKTGKLQSWLSRYYKGAVKSPVVDAMIKLGLK